MQNGRLKTTEGGRSLPDYQGSSLTKSKEPDTAARYAQFTRPFPSSFEKIGGLACQTIDRDEERDGKQREVVEGEKTNTRRLRVYYLYTMSRVRMHVFNCA